MRKNLLDNLVDVDPWITKKTVDFHRFEKGFTTECTVASSPSVDTLETTSALTDLGTMEKHGEGWENGGCYGTNILFDGDLSN